MTTVLILCMAAARGGDMHIAISEGKPDLALTLLASHPEWLEQKDDDGLTPLNAAAFHGDLNLFKTLLSRGANLNEGDNEGSLPLHNSAAGGQIEILKYLVSELQQDVNAVDNNQVSALHFAAGRGYEDIIIFLLDSGADPTISTNQGSTPLFDACFSNNLNIIKSIVEHGADVNQPNIYDVTPLHLAAGYCEPAVVDYLLAQGAMLKAESRQGENALIWAVIRQNFDVADRLFELGLNINDPNAEGRTIMHRMWNMTPEALDYAIAHEADIHFKALDGNQPIHAAAWTGRADIVQKLLEAGADPNALSGDGRTPLLNAASSDSLAVVELLLNFGADVNPKSCLKNDICSFRQGTPLHLATAAGSSNIAAVLLKQGADPNFPDQINGQNALHAACIRGYDDIARLLIDNGADVNQKDNNSKTPLYYCEKHQHPQLADLLKKHHGKSSRLEKVNRTDFLTRTPDHGDAVLLYLDHSGYAVKTSGHFLIFDYWERGRMPENPALANGWINPDEIADQKVTVFVSHEHRDHYQESIFEWEEKIADLNIIMGFEDPSKTGYIFIPGRQTKVYDDMRITTIESNDTGVGFLVEVDGVSLFHAGDHANREVDFSGNYLTEIEFLQALDREIDLAFMPISGCGFGDLTAVKEGIYRTLLLLEPDVFIPVHSGGAEFRYREFIEEAQENGFKMHMPCVCQKGDRFWYKNGRIKA